MYLACLVGILVCLGSVKADEDAPGPHDSGNITQLGADLGPETKQSHSLPQVENTPKTPPELVKAAEVASGPQASETHTQPVPDVGSEATLSQAHPQAGYSYGTVTVKERCFSDNDCPRDRTCDVRSRRCEDPCEDLHQVICGQNAYCLTRNHFATCACRPGTSGQPFEGCFPTGNQAECYYDRECLPDKVCANRRCVDPCSFRNQCGENADCTVRNHVPYCSCRPGYTGDPHVRCEFYTPPKPKGECQGHDQCQMVQACVNNKCVDPCKDRCGGNTECRVSNHVPSCSCKDGFRGDPFQECKPHKCSLTWPPSSGKKKFYLVLTAKLEWHGAYMHCYKNNSRLARIENEAESLEVLKLIGGTNIKGTEFWLGASDHAEEGRWVWLSTAEPVIGFTFWNPGNPNNWANEDCLTYYEEHRHLGYKWNDAQCDKKFNFVCEYYD